MWHELAVDDTFWATAAAASTALLIAVVVEGRDARERLERLALEAASKRLEALDEREKQWQAWTAEFGHWETGGGEDPGRPPQWEPIPEDDPRAETQVTAQGGRVGALLIALWTLTLSLLGSLVILIPVTDPGAIAVVGMVVTLGCLASGAGGLVWATTTRVRSG